MGNFFSSMGGALGKGFNVLGSAIKTSLSPFIGWTSPFFPAPQKKIITGTEVSKTPAAPIVGYRPQQKDAVTLSTPYQRWWDSAKKLGAKIIEPFKTSIMGYNIKDLSKNVGTKIGTTALKVVEETSKKVIETLPNYFMQKWGLVPREDTGERLGNTPVVRHDIVLHQNETQANAPVAQPSGIIDFFKNMLSSQPKGTYSIGYPQSEPIPVPYPVPVGEQAVDKGGTFNWIWIVVIAIGAIILVRSIKK